MLADFYEKILIPPTGVEHGRTQLKLAVCQVKQATKDALRRRDWFCREDVASQAHSKLTDRNLARFARTRACLFDFQADHCTSGLRGETRHLEPINLGSKVQCLITLSTSLD